MVVRTEPPELTVPLERARAVVCASEAGADYPDSHAVSVAVCAARVATALELDEQDVEVVMTGALLHDVGKLRIDRQILDKRGPLTDAEREHVNTHPAEGERMIGRRVDRRIAQVVRSHHERWDGGGYPDRLAAEQIPVAARIVAVADAFLAMQEDRPYRSALPLETALSELRSAAGSQFDPRCVEALRAVVAR
jgi:putative nucleotidyltransferase with HDIG domain